MALEPSNHKILLSVEAREKFALDYLIRIVTEVHIEVRHIQTLTLQFTSVMLASYLVIVSVIFSRTSQLNLAYLGGAIVSAVFSLLFWSLYDGIKKKADIIRVNINEVMDQVVQNMPSNAISLGSEDPPLFVHCKFSLYAFTVIHNRRVVIPEVNGIILMILLFVAATTIFLYFWLRPIS